MTDKLVFLELYMTDVRDPEELISYRDLLPYFDQIRGDHQPNPTQPSNDDRSLSSRQKEKKNETIFLTETSLKKGNKKR